MSSTTMMFNVMEKNGLPEHLVDSISNKVHRIFSKDVFQEINTMYTPFEKIFLEENDVFDKLKILYPDMSIHVDKYYEWITVVIKLNATKFIVWHHYEELYVLNCFLMEGEFNKDTNTYFFDKFVYMDRNYNIIHDAEKYFKTRHGHINWIPFQFLDHFMLGYDDEYCYGHIEKNSYKNAEKYGKWVFYKNILDTFADYPWVVRGAYEEDTYYADYE